MDPQLYDALKSTHRLPSPSRVALAIIKLMQSDNYRLEDLTHLVQSDPVIAGCVLKFANSSRDRNDRAIVSLRKAVTALGAVRVRDLVLGFSVLHSHHNGQCGAFDLQKFWSKSLAIAIANQELSPHCKIEMVPEDNFTIGLLCNIGELAMATLYPDAYGELLAQAAPARLALEVEHFGTDHRELGAVLLTEWGLPEFLVRAAYHHERPVDSGFTEGSRNQMLTLSLHFSRKLAEICIASDNERWHMLPKLVTIAARLGITSDEMTSLADRVVASWQEWGRALEIRTLALPAFADLLAASPPIVQQQASEFESDLNAANPRSILLIGSLADESEGIRPMLELTGRVVKTAKNHKQGLVAAQCDCPQILVADLDRDTGKLCRSLQDNPATRNIYIILIASEDQEAELNQAINYGVDDFLIKPVSANALNMRLRNAQRVLDMKNEIWRERRGVMHTADLWAVEQRRLLHSAMTDPLTKLPNRRHGEDFLSSTWASASTNATPLACLMLDIDFFKQVNDQYGHEAGDRVLAQIADLIKLGLRRHDLAFRYGGEEFVIVCAGASKETAMKVGERIRSSVEREIFLCGKLVVPVTVSIGVGIMDASHADHKDMLREADQALYRAKRSGRNRVELGCKVKPVAVRPQRGTSLQVQGIALAF